MADIEYILDGQPCNPSNRREIGYVFDFSSRKYRSLELTIDALEFVAEDFDRIKTYKNQFGDYVGMPLDVVYPANDVNPAPLTVRYLLDFSDPSTVFRTRSCKVKMIRYKGMDNFFDLAEGLSFGILNWNPNDFRDIDYVVVPETSFLYYISLSLATFSLSQELAKAIQEISEGITDLIKATVPVGFPPAPDWGAIIVAAIKLAARIAYAIFIIIALIKLATEILNLIFPQIRQFKGCELKRLIQKGCEHLNYTLASTMLDAIPDAVVCPVPLRAKDPTLFKQLFAPLSLAYTYGYPSVRDSIRSLGEALNFLEQDLNAIVKIENGNIVRIEQEAYFEQNATTQIPEAFNQQDQLQDETSINSDEIFKRLVVTYQTDPSDMNTYDDSRKTLYEASSEIQSLPSPDYEMIKGLKSVNLPFARGTRKGSLTFAEEAAKVFAQAIDLFCGTSFGSGIESRKDVMQVSNQYSSVTKLLYMNGSRLVENQNDYIGAEAIAQNYWASRLIQNNQKTRKLAMPVAMTQSEFFAIEANNYVLLDSGETIKINRVSWNDYTNMAEVDYEKKKAPINETTTVINAG